MKCLSLPLRELIFSLNLNCRSHSVGQSHRFWSPCRAVVEGRKHGDGITWLPSHCHSARHGVPYLREKMKKVTLKDETSKTAKHIHKSLKTRLKACRWDLKCIRLYITCIDKFDFDIKGSYTVMDLFFFFLIYPILVPLHQVSRLKDRLLFVKG